MNARSKIITTIVAAGAVAMVSTVAACGTQKAADDRASAVSEQPRNSSPDPVLTDYNLALQLFDSQPDIWGGAYVDGDVLAIKYVDQSEAEARQELHAAGVSDAARLEKSDVSMSDFDRAQQALSALAKERGDFVSWGPNYQTSSIALDVTGDASGLEEQLGVTGDVPVTVNRNVQRGAAAGN